ncbi:MAG TPA: hemerythrin domain-containing protein [Anaeromyxobacter sp.]
MDAIQLILSDHRDVEKLFKEFERAARAGDVPRQAEIVRSLVRELSIHAAVEEQFVYPLLRERAGEARVLEALEEHHGAKVTLDELGALPAGHPRRAAKVRLLAESVRRHVQEEERELLPALKRTLEDRELRQLGETLVQAKRAAPTRPHPASPDSPPANIVTAAVAAVFDRSRDALRDGVAVLRTIFVQSARSAFDAFLGFARRAQQRTVETVTEALDQGREAVEEARVKARETVTEARAAADRVEVRGAEAAREARRSGRAAARAARKGAQAVASAYGGRRSRSRRSRR